jgi:hypothetical protein
MGEPAVVQAHERSEDRSDERDDLPRGDLGAAGQDRRDGVAAELEDDGRAICTLDHDVENTRDAGCGKTLESIDEPHRAFLRDGRVERHDGHGCPRSGVESVATGGPLEHRRSDVTAVSVARSPEDAVPRDELGSTGARHDVARRRARREGGGLIPERS